jgi:hypothetical protein
MRRRSQVDHQDLILAMMDKTSQQFPQHDQLPLIELAKEHTELDAIAKVLAGLEDCGPSLVVGDIIGHQEVIPPCLAPHLVTIPI